MDSLDQEILKTAVELCQRLRLSKRYAPQKIGWSQKVPWDYCFFSPGVRKRSELILPLSLRTQVEPALWRPLLTYSLIQVRSRPRDTLVPFFMFVISQSAFAFALAYVSLAYGKIPILALGIIPIFLTSALFSLRRSKRSLLRHVQQAAEVIGREVMLTALEKINSLGIQEVERAKKRQRLIRRFWPIPNIVERIEYLRTLERRQQTQ